MPGRAPPQLIHPAAPASPRLRHRVLASVARAAFLAGGVITAHSRFSAQCGAFLTPALLLMVVFTAGSCISMWRRASSHPVTVNE